MSLELISALIFGSITAFAIAAIAFPRWIQRGWLRYALPWAAVVVCIVIIVFVVLVMGSRGRRTSDASASVEQGVDLLLADALVGELRAFEERGVAIRLRGRHRQLGEGVDAPDVDHRQDALLDEA